ncbi:MAG: PLP-dependent cysteine synthase family protein [Burkholderiales bacterium]|nr:MAG: PLP-dependent cysteine synthase family protein [Burkholderiales bacterium]
MTDSDLPPRPAPAPRATPPSDAHRAWVGDAIATIAAELNRSADTHLLRLPLPALPGIDLYLKDESTHPTGSLKHRLARSLFLYGLVNGHIREGTTIVEASSGSTAISEAYFARLLALPFVAVAPEGTAARKLEQIALLGGECVLVPGAGIYAAAARIARERGGHYMDQFTNAERVTDWRGNNNIAESLFAQMSREPHPVPAWVVVGAGTGGTSATLGRWVRYRPRYAATRIAVADPEFSVFHAYHRDGDASIVGARGSRIEGIGRPRVEPSFVRELVDEVIPVPDAQSLGAIRWLERVIGRRVGGSTGTNLCAALALAQRMHARGESGSVVTLICDGGERYADTIWDASWLAREGLDPAPHAAHLRDATGIG